MSSSDHQRKFKNASKSEDLRRHRTEGSVELRKVRKDDQLMKRRNIDIAAEDDVEPGEVSSPECAVKINAKSQKATLSLEESMEIFENHPSRIGQAVESIRRWLSRQTNPDIDDVLKIGALPHIIKALECKDPKIQFEAAWALTNISSGTSKQTCQVVRAGAVPFLVNLLNSDEFILAEQACWALGNIAGDGANLRDVTYKAGILVPILALCQKPISTEFVRTLVWTISNLCRNKNPLPSDEAILAILPILSQLLSYDDNQTIVDTCWALAYISDSNDDRVQYIINHGLVPKMVAVMGSYEPARITPALRCLGNIVTGTDVQTQVVVDSGVLKSVLPALTRSGKSEVVKEAMWLLSNIIAGNQSQIQAVIDADLIPISIEVISKGTRRSKFEAMWVVSNLSTGGNVDQVKYLLQFGEEIFPAFCNCLCDDESRMISLALDSITTLLHAASKCDYLEKATVLIEECGGLDKLEKLQCHTNEQIYEKALRIIGKYFSEDETEPVVHEPGNGSLNEFSLNF